MRRPGSLGLIAALVWVVVGSAGVLLGTAAGSAAAATFSPSATEQTYTVPAGVTMVHVVVVGAPGDTNTTGTGGNGEGARVTSDLAVTPGAILYVHVPGFFGGFDGSGGAGGGSTRGQHGGGASDIRTVCDPAASLSCSASSAGSLTSRLIVAGGGGGGGAGASFQRGVGGNGGSGTAFTVSGGSGQAGTDGFDGVTGLPGTKGFAGTGSAGGSGGSGYPIFGGGDGDATNGGQGAGGSGGTHTGTGTFGGGGGGGGYFGGGGGGGTDSSSNGGGGGGGSSFVSSQASSVTFALDTALAPQVVITPPATVTPASGGTTPASGGAAPAGGAAPTPAQASFSVSEAVTGHVLFDASTSRPAGAKVSTYAWNIDGHSGPEPNALCGGDASQLSARLGAGTHTISLSVDGSGGVSSSSKEIVVPRLPRIPPPGALARTAAGAPLTQVYVCSPGPNDHPGGPPAPTGPPPGCATEVQFGLVDALGCLNAIGKREDWPRAEQKIMDRLRSEACICGTTSRSAPGVALLTLEDSLILRESPHFSTSTVRINGIDFTPAPGAAIVLVPDQNLVISSNATMSLGPIPIKTGPIVFYVPQGVGRPSKVHIDDYTLSKEAKRIGIGTFPFDGSIGLDLAYHRAELPVHVTLPNAFTLGDGQPIEGAVTLSTDNSHGWQLDKVHVTVPDAYLGPLKITSLFFDYQREHNAWSGGANFLFPGGGGLYAAPPPPDQGFGVSDGSLNHIGATLVFPEPLQLFPGIGLTHIGFTFGLNPTRFSGNVGLNAGDLVNVDGSLIGVFASPDAPYTITGDEGPGLGPTAGRKLTSTSFAAGGAVSLITPAGDIPLGDGYLLYQFPDYAEFGGGFFYGVHDVFSVDGHINGFLQVSRRRFNVEAGMHACIAVLGCTGVDGVISSNGIAACWSQTIVLVHIRVGVGYHWGDSFPDVYLLGCDVGPYRATAASAQAGGPHSFTVPSGLPFATVRVRGLGDAPRVTLAGPHGEKLTTPDNSDVFADANFALLRQPQSKTTFIGIKRPTSGTWTVTAQAGSPAIGEVSNADGLPAPQITAHVTGTGTTRTLQYDVKPEPGQRVSFAEKGPATWRVIGQAGASHGAVRFTPGAGPLGQRTIVALIDHNGLPTRQLQVATYSTPTPPRLDRPDHLRVVRRGRNLIVTWTTPGRALRYAVTVSLSDGRQVLVAKTSSRPSAQIPNVAPTLAGTVRVVSVGPAGARGRAASVRFARARPLRPAPVPRLHA